MMMMMMMLLCVVCAQVLFMAQSNAHHECIAGTAAAGMKGA
jgi:hypothetical protein